MITFLTLPFPGVRRVGEEGKKLGLWELVIIEGERINIPAADTYILGSWHPAYSQLLGLNGKIGILVTSSAGELDMEPIEQEWLHQILIDPRISFIWFGSESLSQVFPEKSFFAPYPLSADIKPPDIQKQNIITLFCPTGFKKNIYSQLCALAIIQRQRNLTLHTNVQGYNHILSMLDCVRHGWLPTEDYHRLLASARVNLACSWCETFNYNVAEAGLLGTPSVVSPTIDWYPLPELMVKNPNDPLEIREKIVYALHNTLGSKISQEIKKVAQERNQRLKEIIKEVIK